MSRLAASGALHKRLTVNVDKLSRATKQMLCETVVDSKEAPEIRRIRKLVETLLQNPRKQLVRRAGSGRYVHFEVLETKPDGTQKWQTYSGLRPTLEARFYPGMGDEAQLPGIRAAPGVVELPRDKQPPERKNTNASMCIGYGTEHGALVHSQIQRVIDSMLYGYRSPMDANESIDPCTGTVLGIFNEEGWVPVATEYPLFDEVHRVATQADIIVFDTNAGKLRVIELTFGYENIDFINPISPDDTFARPLHMVPNSAAQRKLLQLWMTTEMLHRRYGLRDLERTLIQVRPRSHDVLLYSNVPWWQCTVALRDAYDSLAAGNKRKRESSEHSKRVKPSSVPKPKKT